MSIFSELKRRNVFRVAIAYLAAAWLITEVSETLFPLFGYSDTPARIIVILLAVGLPLFLVFSWIFELTPEGLKWEKDVIREKSITPQTGKRIDRLIIVLLIVAVGYFSFDKFVLEPVRDAAVMKETAEQARSEALVESYGDKSIAVLPFVNMSTDPEQEYFSEGISEELLNLLTKIPELRVVSRSSSFSYKGKEIDIPTIAKKLKVAHILEGSVRRDEERIRITAQLIEARSDTHLWSETYDRTMDDIFAIQDEIAATVIKQLKITLLGEVPRVPRTDPEAYTLVLLADHLRMQGTSESLNRSIAMIKQALEIDPNYAIAWRNLAVNYGYMDTYKELSPDEAYELALEAVEKALAIDPDYGLAYSTLGFISLDYEDDFPKAAEQFSRALELDPLFPGNLSNAGQFLLTMGRVNESILVYEYLLGRDPLHTYSLMNVTEAYLFAGRSDPAIISGETLLNLIPGKPWVHYLIGRAYLLKGQVEIALEAFKQEPFEYFRLLGEVMAYYDMDRQNASDAALELMISNFSQERAFYIAGAMSYRNEPDRAFEWLKKSVENDETDLVWIVAESLFTNIHKDPRWLHFLETRKMLPTQLDVIEFHVKLPE